MAIKIRLPYSSSTGVTPTATNLLTGEIAVNTADAKLWVKHSDGTLKLITATGSQGSQGSQGTQGPTGFAGPLGNTGPQGGQGIQGLQGTNSGVQGPAGFQGRPGPQGTLGPQGTQGTAGPGLQGFPGTTSAVTGPQGFPGPTGATGTQGTQGTQGVATGPQGFPGPVGATGLQGPTGAQGTQGPQGLQGFRGPTGPGGPLGATGPQGALGSPGATGLQGPQGPQGFQGVTGPNVPPPVSCTGTTCFLGSSYTTMADGTRKMIKDVQIGDWLMGAFGEANQVLASEDLTLEDRPMFIINYTHHTTSDHPHVTPDKRFVVINPAETLKEWGAWFPCFLADGTRVMLNNIGLDNAKDRIEQMYIGDTLQTTEGPKKVEQIDSYYLPPDTKLYNFVMSGSHTYSVDGYFVTGWPRDDDFDYTNWKQIGETSKVEAWMTIETQDIN